MNPIKNKIGIKEYIAIAILLIGSKLADDTPSILYQSLLNASWMSPIISGIIAIFLFYLLIKVIQAHKDKNFLDIIGHLLGKHFGWIILCLLWFQLMWIIIIDSAIYTDIIRTMYFPNTPVLFIYSLLMVVSAYTSLKGLEQIGSVAWIALPYIKISLFFALILTIAHGEADFLFPLFGPGEWTVIREGSLKLSIFGDLIFLCILFPYITNIKDFKLGTYISLIILMIELSIAFMAYLFLFDYETVKLLNFPYHEIIRYISIGFITNLELLFVPFWLIAAFIRFGVYFYISTLLFSKIFKIDRVQYIIPPLTTIVIFLGLAFDSQPFTLFLLHKKQMHISTIAFICLPILLWIIAKIKGDFAHEK